MKSKCYECGYKGDNPGSAHIRCSFDWGKSKNKIPKGNHHGITRGWYNFPLNYDPVWMEEECLSYAKDADAKMIKSKHDPLAELFSILASVGR